MAAATPPGFVSLDTALTQRNVDQNVMGVVVDFQPPGRSKGADWMCTFNLVDSTVYGMGTKARFFRSAVAELPKIRGTGDVVILRGIKTMVWGEMNLLLSNAGTKWTVFHASSIPTAVPSGAIQLHHIQGRGAPIPTPVETRYAVELCNSQDRSTFSTPIDISGNASTTSASQVSTATSQRREKFSLIKDVQIATYYDLVGCVVKFYSNGGTDELYISDYTNNSLMYNYEHGQEVSGENPREGDDYGYIVTRKPKTKWPGPFGYRTLTVTLWDPHAQWARHNVKEGDFVFLRNVHIRWSRNSKLEGALHTDQKYGGRVDITVLQAENDERAKSVLRRKREYWKQFKSEVKDYEPEHHGKKRKAEAMEEATASKPNGLSAKQRRKRKLNRKSKQEAERKLASKSTSPLPKNLTTKPSTTLTKLGLNENVTSLHPTIPPRCLTSILDTASSHAYTTPTGTACTLPFQNICSRTIVRVIDFFPPKLADFAVGRRVSEYDVLSSCSDDEEANSDGEGTDSADEYITPSKDPSGSGPPSQRAGDVKWEWRFALLLEEAAAKQAGDAPKARLLVYVAGADAEFLLNMDPENFRTNQPALATLRERLFILWGDLAERKTAERKARARRALVGRDGNASAEAEAGSGDGVDRKVGAGAGAGAGASSGRPFACCIKEYGVKIKGAWERRWKIFGTRIA